MNSGSQSIVLTITNSNASIPSENAVIGGSDRFFLVNQQGSDADITINTSSVNSTYSQFLASLVNRPFMLKGLRLISSSSAQRNKSITVTYLDANNNGKRESIFLSQYSNIYQSQLDIINIDYEILFDAQTYFTLPIVRSQTVILELIPKSMSDLAQPLKQC